MTWLMNNRTATRNLSLGSGPEGLMLPFLGLRHIGKETKIASNDMSTKTSVPGPLVTDSSILLKCLL